LAPLTGHNGGDAEGTLITPVARVPLTEGGFAHHHYQQALAVARIEDAAVREERIRDGAVSMPMIERAAADTSAAFFVNLLDDLNECLQEFAVLNDALKTRCGADAPPSSNIRSALESCRDAIRHIARDKLPTAAVDVGETTPASASAAAGPAANPDTPRDREDAFQTLLHVAAFFRRSEPHSPVSYALENAVRWGRMTLPELMAELLSVDASRQEYFKQVGIRASAPSGA
jgi:type VI secretion system protein ImpA